MGELTDRLGVYVAPKFRADDIFVLEHFFACTVSKSIMNLGGFAARAKASQHALGAVPGIPFENLAVQGVNVRTARGGFCGYVEFPSAFNLKFRNGLNDHLSHVVRPGNACGCRERVHHDGGFLLSPHRPNRKSRQQKNKKGELSREFPLNKQDELGVKDLS